MPGGGSQKVQKSPEEKALTKIAGEAYARNKTVYDPIVDKYITKAKDSTAPLHIAQGAANAETQKGFEPLLTNVAKQDFATGAAPNGSGRFEGDLGNAIVDKTQSRGLSLAGARGAAKDIQLGRLGQLISYGQGRATQATAGLADAASVAQKQSIYDANAASQQRNQVLSGVGSLAGAGYGAYKAGAFGGGVGNSGNLYQGQDGIQTGVYGYH